VLEFEHPLNIKQELAFICYCTKCEMRNWDRQLIHSYLQTAIDLAYKSANINLNVRVLNAAVVYKARFLNNNKDYSNEGVPVTLDSFGIRNNDQYLIK